MKKLHAQLGFTMIELLIVITILGILAVAVLSAINPIEQINRGRDTGSQSDAEQLLSAIDRYNAFQGYYPWQVDANANTIPEKQVGTDDGSGGLVPVGLDDDAGTIPGWTGDNSNYCSILNRLSTGNGDYSSTEDGEPTACTGAEEIKESFVTRILNDSARTLYVYNNGEQGSSTYVCFVPRSGAFEEEADTRCGAGFPDDVGAEAEAFICEGTARPAEEDQTTAMNCLP